MKNRGGPLRLISPALVFLACVIGAAMAIGLAGLVAMSHYLGHTLAFIGLGTHRGRLTDDTFVGPILSVLGTPDVELAQTYAAALTGALFAAIFVAARLGYSGLRADGDPPDRPWFQLSPRRLALFALMTTIALGLLWYDYQLFVFRAVTDALIESLKGKYIAGNLPRWALVVQQHGDLYTIDIGPLTGRGYLAVTVGSALVLEFAISRLRESTDELLDAMRGRGEATERPENTSGLDYDELRPVIGSDPEERISIAEALEKDEYYVVDEAGDIYTRSLYERLSLEDAQPGEHTNGGMTAGVLALAIGLSLFFAAPANAASHTPAVHVAFVVDPTGILPRPRPGGKAHGRGRSLACTGVDRSPARAEPDCFLEYRLAR